MEMTSKISFEILELKEWWFNNSNIWFDSNESDDIMIANKYKHLLNIDFNVDFNSDFNNDLMANKKLGIGYIILLDQITRHIVRAMKYSNNLITDNLNKIIDFVKIFYSKYKNNLEGHEFCFVLLPLRHSNIFENQTFVMKETWDKISNVNSTNSTDSKYQENIKIYKNYLEATYKRSVKGKIYLAQNNFKYNINSKILEFVNEFNEILDINCNNYEINIDINNNSNNLNSKIMKTCDDLKKNINKKNFILSISGGVDSMVLSYILSKQSINFVMIHINYANRGEVCVKEKELLSNWADFIGIKLYIRDIYEINRSKCMEFELRNLYENYTKNARFQSYIDVVNINGWGESEWSILMGHNHDDCIENILTNIANKTKYENLIGMEFESNINFNGNQINFTRPFLKTQKSDIYNFAHLVKIPYLFDSTPKWSQRGMIRDIVRPSLIQWNNLILDGFDELTNTMKESLECVDILVSNWIERFQQLLTLDIKEQITCPSINITYNQLRFDVIKLAISEIKTNKIFWSRLFELINIQISSKSLNELINRLEGIKNKFNMIQIKQLIQIHINKKNKLYCWKINDNKLIIGFY
jgi:tRNA(Ile)-lysidine synthase